MHIPGHLAVALIQHRLIFHQNQKREIISPLLLASLFPDAIDKAIGYIFHWMPNGRHYAHNIFSLVGFSAIVCFIWGRVAGLAWFMGYLGHLVTDSNSLVPWLFPWRSYPFRTG